LAELLNVVVFLAVCVVALENVPVLHGVVLLGVLEGGQLFQFVKPHTFLLEDVNVLCEFLNTVPEEGLAFHLEVLLTSHFVALAFLGCGILLDILTELELVEGEVLSGLVESFEEIHDVAQSDVDFKFVHVLKDLNGFDFTLDAEGNLWSIHL
jgi:hypothetical protein